MKTSRIRRSMWSVGGAAGVLVAGILMGKPAHGESNLLEEIPLILTTLVQMNSLMSAQTAPALSAAATSSASQTTFQQTVVYPTASIVQALAQATRMLSTIQSIHNLVSQPLNSATLPQSIALESQLLGGNTAGIGSISSSYGSVYGTLPPSTAMTSHSLMAVDMTDAAAQASLKKAIEMDGVANQEDTLAQQLMQGLTSSSPGSASLIAAQAAAWNLQAQAYTQGAFAQLLRLQAAETAYSGQQTKKAVATQFPSMSGAQ
jgi:hypothetical protein